MSCIWNENLHEWRVNRSNRHSQKQFLHPDHWIQLPKSREHNKHIWSVFTLRIGPVAASLNRLIDLPWRTIATSHSTNRTCAHLDLQLQNNRTSSSLKMHAQMVHAYRSTDMHCLLNETIWIHQAPFWPLHTDTFRYQYQLWKMNLASFSCSPHLTYITKISSIDATHYWPFSREYSIWNATVTTLQIWTADLEPHILSDAIEWVYTAFFCSNSAQHLRSMSEEVLFGHFVTNLNDAFEWELTLEDEGYKSGSESLNIPTPLCRTLCLYHISASENLSFNPTTPLTSVYPHWVNPPQQHRSHSSVHHYLAFSNDESPSTDGSQLHGRSSPVQQQMVYHCMDDSFQATTNEEDEDFPTAPLNDDVWLEEPVPDRHLCIH